MSLGKPGTNTSSLLKNSAFPASASVLISKVAFPSQTLTFKKDIQNVLEARKFGEQKYSHLSFFYFRVLYYWFSYKFGEKYSKGVLP